MWWAAREWAAAVGEQTHAVARGANVTRVHCVNVVAELRLSLVGSCARAGFCADNGVVPHVGLSSGGLPVTITSSEWYVSGIVTRDFEIFG